MLTIKPDQILPESNHSRKQVVFLCECGKEKSISWKNYLNNHTKSCGQCKGEKYHITNLEGKRWGYLTLNQTQAYPELINSKTPVLWDCVCGKTKLINIGSVVRGLTKSCGCYKKQSTGKPYVPPILVPKDMWQHAIPQLVDYELPASWSKATKRLLPFKCVCGNIYTKRFDKWRITTKCGVCDYLETPSLRDKHFGKLRVIDEQVSKIHIRSEKTILCQCECGIQKRISLASLQRGSITSCGACNLRTPEWWLSQTFGHLKVIEIEKPTKLKSESLLKCRCSCGNVCYKEASRLSNNTTKTCGECYVKGVRWWIDKPPISYDTSLCIKDKYTLNYLADYFFGSYLEPQHGCGNLNAAVDFKCLLCGLIFKTKPSQIYNSKTVSCGCVTNKNTKPVLEIAEYLKLYAFDVISEFKLGKYSYDLKVGNLLIEYHGLRYHSYFRDSKDIDKKKFDMAKQSGYDYMLIYEDEWDNRKEIFKIILLNRLKSPLKKPSRIRPQKCEVLRIDNEIANDFYHSYHYIGRCNSSLNIGCYVNGLLVACMSLRHPSRQSKYSYEISRMAQHFDYRVHGIWSYIIKRLKKFLIFGDLVTYSDNRLFDGGTYSKIGMAFDGDVKQDYYWVKSNVRHHKSKLRKTHAEIMTGHTETELREADGYRKIYDLGKKRWVITV